MLPAERLSSYIDALRPIVYIHNFDFNAVDELILAVAGKTPIQEYNNACGKVNFATKIPTSLLSGSFQDNAVPITAKSSEGRLSSFLEESLTDCPQKKIIVLKDVHGEISDPAIIALLKNIAQRTMYMENYWVPILIVSSRLIIPSELEKLITVFDMPYPDRKEIESILSDYAAFYNFTISADTKSELSLAFKGLSEFEITQILNLAYQRSGKVCTEDMGLILREKEQSIKKSGMLEAIHVNSDASDIGGLENLVEYLKRKAEVYKNLSESIKFGVDIPKGILIVGMPGCGKSLTAKACAKLFKAPLLRLDVGKLLGKYVGESEDNLRRAISLAEAATPCVLWIDEIEKAFAGVGKDESGGGVTTRLFGYFLTWMQEKESTVYVVATANDITNIPPEFLRRGRFDEIFSVDLPNDEERKRIFEIHLRRRKKNWKNLGINLNALVKATAGKSAPEYSGADIESIVKGAIETAFWDRQKLKENNDPAWDKRDLTHQDLLDMIPQTIPIAKTMAEKIKTLKESLGKYQIKAASRSTKK